MDFVRRLPLIVRLLFSAAVFLLLVFGKTKLSEAFGLHGYLWELLLETVLTALLGYAAFFALIETAWLARRPLWLIYRTIDDLRNSSGYSGVAVKFYSHLMEVRLANALDAEKNILKPKGLRIGLPDMKAFAVIAFNDCNGRYFGTDHHPPSKYRTAYPEYLHAQVKNQSPERELSDIRILLVTESSLLEDFQEQPHSFRNFVEFHRKHDIELLHVDPQIASSIAARMDYPSAAIGVFGNDFSVFFHEVGNSYHLLIVPLTNESLPRLRGFMENLLEHARSVSLGYGGVPRSSPLTRDQLADLKGRLPC